MTTLTSEILDLSADLIQKRGWRKDGGWNNRENHGGQLCLEGGIMAALGVEWPSEAPVGEEHAELKACPAYQAVAEYLGDQLTVVNGEACSLFWWNDVPERTAEEVVEVLRSAAAVERVKEAALVAVPA